MWSEDGSCISVIPLEEMVVVEFLPEGLRKRFKDAGKCGVPCEGSLRIAVERTCAEFMLAHDSPWVILLPDENPADYYIEQPEPPPIIPVEP